jgi:hypothetical protein
MSETTAVRELRVQAAELADRLHAAADPIPLNITDFDDI